MSRPCPHILHGDNILIRLIIDRLDFISETVLNVAFIHDSKHYNIVGLGRPITIIEIPFHESVDPTIP